MKSRPPEPRTFAKIVAAAHVIVLGAGIWRLTTEPSWVFALLLLIVGVSSLYWIREGWLVISDRNGDGVGSGRTDHQIPDKNKHSGE